MIGTTMAQHVRGERFGWREAFGFLIGSIFMACPLFIGTVEILFIGFELYKLIYLGTILLETIQICFVTIIMIPLVVTVISFILLFPTIPLGMVALSALHSGGSGMHLLVVGLSICVAALASLALYTVFLGGVSGSDVGSLAVYFSVAALAQGTVVAIATRMARRHPA